MRSDLIEKNLLSDIKQVIEQARTQVKQSVNSAMVQTYWNIGRLIVEEEQQGQTRAAYGKAQLQALSAHLAQEFGKGFDVTNLRNMRRFYNVFPIRDAVSLELSGMIITLQNTNTSNKKSVRSKLMLSNNVNGGLDKNQAGLGYEL